MDTKTYVADGNAIKFRKEGNISISKEKKKRRCKKQHSKRTFLSLAQAYIDGTNNDRLKFISYKNA